MSDVYISDAPHATLEAPPVGSAARGLGGGRSEKYIKKKLLQTAPFCDHDHDSLNEKSAARSMHLTSVNVSLALLCSTLGCSLHTDCSAESSVTDCTLRVQSVAAIRVDTFFTAACARRQQADYRYYLIHS